MTASTTAEKIRRAALKLFEQGGVQAVSMRRVADAVGITPMAIYRHFANREVLLKRLSDDSFQAMAQDWAAQSRQGDVLKRLPHLMTPYLDYALRHPHLFDHAFALPRDDARRFPSDFRAGQSPTLTLVADTVTEGIEQGVLRDDDAWDVAMTMWAHAHGLIVLYRAGRFSYSEAQFRRFYLASLQRLIDGLKN